MKKKGFLASLFFSLAFAGYGVPCDMGIILVSADGSETTAKLADVSHWILEKVDGKTTITTKYIYLDPTSNTKTVVLGGRNDVALVNGENLSVYPNPVSDKIFISGAGDEPTVVITSVGGAVMLKAIGKEVNVSSLASGLYLLNVDGKVIKFNKK